MAQSIIDVNTKINKLNEQLITKNSIKYTKVWEYKNPTGQAIYSTPIVAKFSDGRDVIIYTGYDWYLYVHDFEGNLIWRYDCGSNNYGRCQATIIDNQLAIFVGSHSGRILCINEDATLKFSFSNLYEREGNGTITSAGSYYFKDISKSWVANSFIRGNVQGYNASVSIISGTGIGQTLEISGVDSNDHSKIWLFDNWVTIPDSTSQYKITPKYTSDIFYQHAGTLIQEGFEFFLYSTCFDNQCTKINARNGNLIWRYSALGNNEPYPSVTDINKDGILECIFGSVDGKIRCLNATNGLLLWETTLDSGNDAFSSYGDIDNDGIIEFVCNDRSGRCTIINGNTGEIKYKSTSIGSALSTEINTKPILYDINGDGYKEILFGCYIGFIYCLNYKGETLWRYNQGTTLRGSSNVIEVNGQILVISGDMTGCLSILNQNGVELGQIHVKGSCEGTPLCGNLINDGNNYILTTSTDGYITLWKFN